VIQKFGQGEIKLNTNNEQPANSKRNRTEKSFGTTFVSINKAFYAISSTASDEIPARLLMNGRKRTMKEVHTYNQDYRAAISCCSSRYAFLWL